MQCKKSYKLLCPQRGLPVMLHGFKAIQVNGKTGEIASDLVDEHYEINLQEGS